MSKEPAYLENIKDLRKKFLDPLETNRDDLLSLISSSFDSLSMDEDIPFLSQNPGNYSFLKNYSSIPEMPRARDEVLGAASSILQGQVRWHSPKTLHNVTPPVLIDSVAVSTLASLYMPNMLWDFCSAGTQQAERQIIDQIVPFLGWHKDTEGSFSAGGKSCFIYAIRMGLNRCLPGVSSSGLSGKKKPVVITSKSNHYVIEHVCSLLGLGKNSCIRVDAHENETLNLISFENVLSQLIEEETPIACIVLSGGGSLHINIDPILKAKKVIDSLIKKYNLKYEPFVYVDLVNGWPWLFFKDYDFKLNKLEINDISLKKIKETYKKVSEVTYVDAIGLDFHKVGFCPYGTSLFMTKHRNEFFSINEDEVSLQERKPYGENFLQHFTIEHSRSANAPLAAWTMFQNVGIIGIQSYIGHLVTIGDVFRNELTKYSFELLNPFSVSSAAVVFPILSDSISTYEELLQNADENQIASLNSFALQIYYELYSAKEWEEKLLIRFLQRYRLAKCGKWFSALSIYPMSMFITSEMAEHFSKIIGNTKLRVEMDYKKHGKSYSKTLASLHK